MQRKRVTLEAPLENVARNMNSAERRLLARRFYRWARQLYYKADIMEQDEASRKPPKVVKPIPPAKQLLN